MVIQPTSTAGYAAGIADPRQAAAARVTSSASGSEATPTVGLTSNSLESSLSSLVATQAGVSNAVSFTQTQSGYLTAIANALDSMSKLAESAQAGSLSDSELASASDHFQQFSTQIGEAAAQSFNGVSLFSGASLSVGNVADDATSFTLPGIDLSGTDLGFSGGLSTTDAASATLSNLHDASDKIALAQHTALGNESRLITVSDRLSASADALSPSFTAHDDSFAADTDLMNVRSAILNQSSSAVSAQANQIPQSVLNLLPQ